MKKRVMSILAIIGVIGTLAPLMSAAGVEDSRTAELEARVVELENTLSWYKDRMEKLHQNAEAVCFASDELVRCDINGDGLINTVDASIILKAYTLLSTGESVTKISQVEGWECYH